MLTDKRGYSTLLWVGFLTFMLVPLVALTVNLGRVLLCPGGDV